MAKPTNIAHPLKNRRGASQRKRVIGALKADAVQIDGRKLVDMLQMIGEYAKRVNHYKYRNDQRNGEYMEMNNWSVFFEKSLPFQLARFSKISKDKIEQDFLDINTALEARVMTEYLNTLLKYIFSEIIQPVSDLYKTVSDAENSLSSSLSAIIKSAMAEALKAYISISNAAAQFLCTDKQPFNQFLNAPWKLAVIDIYDYDTSIQLSTGGQRAAILLAQQSLKSVFYQLLNGLQLIIESAPDFIEESLIPLQESLREKHQPHLGLLFTFLELFKHFQGDLNQLTQQHLDFFYQRVLQIQPKEAKADQAHLVLEIANHLDQYPLPKGLLFKNGKDDNGADIIFSLDEEIIIDKTEITELKTLFLNPRNTANSLEGEYIAPIANTADGQGEKFKNTAAQNWSSLGAKYSKYINPDTELLQEHPHARLGFVLSSPVLLLQEGKRIITITLKCEASSEDRASEIITCLGDKFIKTGRSIEINNDLLKKDFSDTARKYLSSLLEKETPYLLKESLNDFKLTRDDISCEPIFSIEDKVFLNSNNIKNLERFVPLFNISFSGEEEWVAPKVINTEDNINIEVIHPTLIVPDPDLDPVPAPTYDFNVITFKLTITLDADDPAVTFYNEKVLKEKIDLKTPYPLVKIELNPAFENIKDLLGGDNDNSDGDDACCLKRNTSTSNQKPSIYECLRGLVLIDSSIKVEVCGVKNLIVQNDENLQDVNSPILPFGTRPKVGTNFFIDAGANFYIGSREIFCKNWTNFWINIKWKDLPSNIADHYSFYSEPNYEDGSNSITQDSFRFATSILNNGVWKKHNEEKYGGIDPVRKKLFRLFDSYKESTNPCLSISINLPEDTFSYQVEDDFSPSLNYVSKSMPLEDIEPLTVDTRKGFAKLTLAGVSFQHHRFTFVLTRQMSALAGILDPVSINDANNMVLELENLGTKIRDKINATFQHITTIKNDLISIKDQINDFINNNNIVIDGIITLIGKLNTELISALGNIGDDTATTTNINEAIILVSSIEPKVNDIDADTTSIQTAIDFIFSSLDNDTDGDPNIFTIGTDGAIQHINRLVEVISDLKRVLDVDRNVDNGIPNEPYTPTIKSLSIDYTAKADKDDIDIIHLYPYQNTSRWEDITQKPTLLPSFHDEGTLYIGLQKFTPGNNLNLLFQLAEATADSEADRAILEWQYLAANTWLPLREGFEIIEDHTDGLTVSGIVTIAVPRNISDRGNTIMPDDTYWIKVAAKENVSAVAEIIAVYTQAARVSAALLPANDTTRLGTPLPEGSIAKLVEGDFSVKKIEQPFASFGGQTPEISGHFYTRVSEHLRHKGRGQMAFDYERIVLEAFPEIFKAKCISHTMGLSANEYIRDLEVAPGFVVLTVIPDLTKLGAGNTLTPKAPVSLLEKIERHLKNKTSAFARLKVMNPRYEKIDVNISVRLQKGKPQNFYASQLKEDLTHFLAPWYLGDSEKIAFGQNVLFSDVVGFVEHLEYIDFIQNIELTGECEQTGNIIRPLTARSILTGGEICVSIDLPDCGKTTKEQVPKIG